MRTSRKVALNRPVFAQSTFDSSALTVLTTLFHRFPEAGDYDLFIRRHERVIHRARVQVVKEGASRQINVDLAALGGSAEGRDCEAGEGYTLVVDGVMAFYVSRGVGQYSVRIVQFSRGEKRTLLDSQHSVPEGDLFAVTLVRPGTYRVLSAEGRSKGEIRVSLPQGKPYRPDQATLVKVRKRGVFDPRRAQLFAGQTVVFQCTAPTRLRLELVEAGETPGKPNEPPHR